MSIVIHLEECEPEGKGWTQVMFSEASRQGARFCFGTEYMANEMYVDEPVWIETVTDKPQWAQKMLRARELEREAHRLQDEALITRCDTEDGGGVRCTLDALPEGHAHRHSQEDLP